VHTDGTTRFFAFLLGFGGIIGIATIAMMVVSRGRLSPSDILLICFGVPFAFAIFTGFRLWQGTPLGAQVGGYSLCFPDAGCEPAGCQI